VISRNLGDEGHIDQLADGEAVLLLGVKERVETLAVCVLCACSNTLMSVSPEQDSPASASSTWSVIDSDSLSEPDIR